MSKINGQFQIVDGRAVAPDGTVFGHVFRKGIYNVGKTTVGEFARSRPELCLNIPASLLRVVETVSRNEGKLEAINTWDAAYLSFGIFQWTTGVKSDRGELAALLRRLHALDEKTYDFYFGQYGLWWASMVDPDQDVARGYLTLGGHVLREGHQKEALRTLEWAYRFWVAGGDIFMRRAQVEHAAWRIHAFWRRKINGHELGEYITSEYGAALLLDQHVNRPAHVVKTLRLALVDLGMPTPAELNAGDPSEAELLDAYVSQRHETTMTNSRERASVIKTAARVGDLSRDRGSLAFSLT